MICVILISLALFVGWKKSAERIVVFGLALWLGYESVLGTMQLFGFAVSNNNMCPMTGGFANSGPYGGFLSTCIAVMLAAVWRLRKPENLYDKILLWLSVVSGSCGIIILPASMSRAGLVALAVTVVIFTLNQTEIRAVLKMDSDVYCRAGCSCRYMRVQSKERFGTRAFSYLGDGSACHCGQALDRTRL